MMSFGTTTSLPMAMRMMIDPTLAPLPRKSLSLALKLAISFQNYKKQNVANMKADGGAQNEVKIVRKVMVKGKGLLALKDTLFNDRIYAELSETPIGKSYGPDFVTDPGIDKYCESHLLMQQNKRFILPGLQGSAVLRSRPTPDDDADPSNSAAPHHIDYQPLSSSPSDVFSFFEGEEVLQVHKQRLPRDPYHTFAQDLATGSSSRVPDLESSAVSSITEPDPFLALFERSPSLSALDLNMPRENSQNLSLLGLLDREDSDMQLNISPLRPLSSMQLTIPPFRPALRPEDSVSRLNSMQSVRSRVGSSQSLEHGPGRYKLKGITAAGSRYYVREASETPDNGSIKTQNSFANLAIEELATKNPQLSGEFETLKDSIEEHNRDLRQNGIMGKKHLERQIDDMLSLMRAKDDKLIEAASILEDSYAKIDAADAKVDSMKQLLTQSETSRARWEHEYNMKARELDIQSCENNNKLVNLEREKRTLVEKNHYIQERLETERIRVKGAEHAKDIAMAASDSMRKTFDFYRNYYDAQAALHGQYFGSQSDYKSSKGNDMQVGHTVVERKETLGRDSAIKQATDLLRDRYRKMIENSEVSEPLRGFEFLAYLENGGAAEDAGNDEEEDVEEAVENEGEEVADGVEDAAPTTFTSNFLGINH